MSIIESVDRYHVVCRDCPTELLVWSAAAASSFTERHADETGHAIVYKQVN